MWEEWTCIMRVTPANGKLRGFSWLTFCQTIRQQNFCLHIHYNAPLCHSTVLLFSVRVPEQKQQNSNSLYTFSFNTHNQATVYTNKADRIPAKPKFNLSVYVFIINSSQAQSKQNTQPGEESESSNRAAWRLQPASKHAQRLVHARIYKISNTHHMRESAVGPDCWVQQQFTSAFFRLHPHTCTHQQTRVLVRGLKKRSRPAHGMTSRVGRK